MPRILLAEDDESIRAVISCALRADGFNVVSAVDGYDAIDCLLKANECFDLLLTDYQMPGMNGYELASAAKSMCPHITILMMSGHVPMGADFEGLEKILAALIEKPFSIKMLRHFVGNLMSHKKLSTHQMPVGLPNILPALEKAL